MTARSTTPWLEKSPAASAAEGRSLVKGFRGVKRSVALSEKDGERPIGVAVARSIRPSPLKSAATMAVGPTPVFSVGAAVKPPWPLLSNTLTSLPRLVGDGQVVPAVAVEVGGDKGLWLRSHGNGRGGRERTVAVAQQDRHGVGAGVGRRQIELAVAQEVARDDGGRRRRPRSTSGERRKRRDRCSAERRRCCPDVRDGQVEDGAVR